jgi:transcriptional regulator NrdR family protein
VKEKLDENDYEEVYGSLCRADHVKEMFADQDNTLEFDMSFDKSGGRQGKRPKRAGGEKVMETAVFLDSAAYSRFAAYYRKIGRQSRV